MFTIRFTRKLLKYLHADPLHPEVAPTTVLGDWYANLLFTRHLRLVICVSERSLLPVFVEAKDRSTFADRLREAVRSVMESSGVTGGLIEGELNEMSQARIGATHVHQIAREVLPALETAEAAMTIAEKDGLPLFVSWAGNVKGCAMAHLEQAEQGVAQIHEGLGLAAVTGAEIWRTYNLAQLAMACDKANRIDEGLRAIAEALDLIQQTW